MFREKKHITYTTIDELRFLRGVGTHAPKCRVTSDLTVEDLYQNYIKSCRLRSDWGHIDKVKVIAEATKLLLLCQTAPGEGGA